MNPFKKIPKMGLLPAANSPMLYRVLGAGQFPDTWTAPRKPTIGSQKVQDCVNWALSYCQEMATGEVFSKNYRYSDRKDSDWQGEGMPPQECLQNALDIGNVLLNAWPSEFEVTEAQKEAKMVETALRELAAAHKIKAYYLCKDISAIKSARMNGFGVIFGAAVDKMCTDKKGVFKCVEGKLGLHAMTIVDWDTTGIYPAPWCVANSWGTDFGVDGFCFMSDEDVLRIGMVYAIDFGVPLADCPNCPTDIVTPVVPVPVIKTRRTLKLQYDRMKDEDGYTDVSEFQTLCNECGIFTAIDGRYGTVAYNACIRFQKMAFGDLAEEVDGICAGNTWAALDRISAERKESGEAEDDEVSDEVILTPVMDLIGWAKEQVGQMYLLGAQGERVYDGMIVKGKTYTADEWIHYRERKSDKYYYRALAFYNTLVAAGVTPIIAYDCSGLLVFKLNEMGIIDYDTTAHGLYRLCENHKATTTNWRDCQPGWLCFQKKWGCNAHHVGLYIGPITIDGVYMPNAVLECKGRDDGVVIRDMRDGGKLQWNRFGVMEEFDDSI